MDRFARAVLLTNAIRDADPRLTDRTGADPFEVYSKPINLVADNIVAAVSDLRDIASALDARLYRYDAARTNLNDLYYTSPMREEVDFASQSQHTPFVTFEGYLGELSDPRLRLLNMLVGKRGVLIVITPAVADLPQRWLRLDLTAQALQKAA
jgi:hypothetical protein